MIKKIILLLAVLLLTTACGIEYKTDINDDGTVEENITLDFSPEICYESNRANPPASCEQFVKATMYKMQENYNLVDYDIEVKEGVEVVEVNFRHNYTTLEEFKAQTHTNYYLFKKI